VSRWERVRIEVTEDNGRVTVIELEDSHQVPLTGEVNVSRETVKRSDDSCLYMIHEPVGRPRVTFSAFGEMAPES
jgi:hypothetical protein